MTTANLYPEGTQFKTWKAWAIHTQSVEGHSTIGPYWFIRAKPECLDGCLPALFRTRAAARTNLEHVRRSFPRAKVIRVTLEMSWL